MRSGLRLEPCAALCLGRCLGARAPGKHRREREAPGRLQKLAAVRSIHAWLLLGHARAHAGESALSVPDAAPCPPGTQLQPLAGDARFAPGRAPKPRLRLKNLSSLTVCVPRDYLDA